MEVRKGKGDVNVFLSWRCGRQGLWWGGQDFLIDSYDLSFRDYVKETNLKNKTGISVFHIVCHAIIISL